MNRKKLSMTFIFYYLHNNLNTSHIIVSHHEAERVITVTATKCCYIKIEHSCISIIIKVTAAQHLNKNNMFKVFPNIKLT